MLGIDNVKTVAPLSVSAATGEHRREVRLEVECRLELRVAHLARREVGLAEVEELEVRMQLLERLSDGLGPGHVRVARDRIAETHNEAVAEHDVAPPPHATEPVGQLLRLKRRRGHVYDGHVSSSAIAYDPTAPLL